MSLHFYPHLPSSLTLLTLPLISYPPFSLYPFQILDMSATLEDTEVQYIVNLTPNSIKIPSKIEGHHLLRQLNSFKISEIAIINKEKFNYKYYLFNFASNFCFLIDGLTILFKNSIKNFIEKKVKNKVGPGPSLYKSSPLNRNKNYDKTKFYDSDHINMDDNHLNECKDITIRETCQCILQYFTENNIIKKENWKIGKYSIFLFNLSELNTIKLLQKKKIVFFIIKIQCFIRKFLARKKLKKLSKKSFENNLFWEHKQKYFLNCVLRIQKCFRGHMARKVT